MLAEIEIPEGATQNGPNDETSIGDLLRQIKLVKDYEPKYTMEEMCDIIFGEYSSYVTTNVINLKTVGAVKGVKTFASTLL